MLKNFFSLLFILTVSNSNGSLLYSGGVIFASGYAESIGLLISSSNIGPADSSTEDIGSVSKKNATNIMTKTTLSSPRLDKIDAAKN